MGTHIRAEGDFHKETYVTVHEKTRYKSKIAILHNAHLKVQTLCYFVQNQTGQMKTKSHLFEIMQFSFLHSVLPFLYISVLLGPNFFNNKKKVYLVFSCTVTYTVERTNKAENKVRKRRVVGRNYGMKYS